MKLTLIIILFSSILDVIVEDFSTCTEKSAFFINYF